VIFLTAEWPN